MKLNDKKVLLAMSGGVDSSTTAALLLEKGYDVTGVTFINYKPKDTDDSGVANESNQNIEDAKKVCDMLKIEHLTTDLTLEFKKIVINYFVNDYLSGRTPNPCTKCNPYIKWGKLLEMADEIGARYFATGHYAGIRYDEELQRYVIVKGADTRKDQSYVLWALSQEKLSRTLLPVGQLTKEKTREIADILDLPVKDKPDSQDNCFITQKNYELFLRNVIPDIEEKIGAGDIVMRGRVVGSHKGYPFYTIGQRHGLGVKYSEPLYVNEIVANKNIVRVGKKEDLYHNKLIANNVNLIKYKNLNGGMEFFVKVRYNDKGQKAVCRINDDGRLFVEFLEIPSSITPGQSVVMYEENDLVGGAVIERWVD